ncbi:MAG: hypothetical protein ACD_41C00299G0009 [uncultured bacterium]|nr:MAG: hypothetical protein ACD_41C00299G0009 [uncultured bacterium]HBY74276.1 hypothetical protein [Candidatus Kerfeldbacteria bacterium]
MALFSMRPRGSYTVRKSGGIFGSIISALLGLGLVAIGSPLAAWYAESQHQAKDFSTATQVASSQLEYGYLAVTGQADLLGSLYCPGTTDPATEPCIWVESDKQSYQRQEKRQCGYVSDDQKILQQLPDECDSDGTNCQSCYTVEEFSWESIDTTTQYDVFKLGEYTVTPTDAVNFIGEASYTTETTTTPQVGDERFVMTYFPLAEVTLVAGTSADGELTAPGDGKPFVISNVDYASTLAELESQDKTMKWGLRILSLVLMVLGMTMLASPLTYFTNIFRIIPFLGSRVDRGFDAIIGFVAALLGVIMWFVLWMLVLVLKNIWIILGVLIIIAVIVLVLIQRGKKQKATTPAPTTSPTGSSQS